MFHQALKAPRYAKSVTDGTAVYRRVWLALQKYLWSQCIEKKRSVEMPLLGKFLQRGGDIALVPHLDFLDSGKFQFPENDHNVSPFSKTLVNVRIHE